MLALIYPRWYRDEAPLAAGLKFGFLMGVFLFSVSTIANAAKIQVNGLGGFIALQLAFHALQFGAAGAVFGLIFGRMDATSRTPSVGAECQGGIQSPPNHLKIPSRGRL